MVMPGWDGEPAKSSASPSWAWPHAPGPGAAADAGAPPWQDEVQSHAKWHWGGILKKKRRKKSQISHPKQLLHTPKPRACLTAALGAETNQSLSVLLSS